MIKSYDINDYLKDDKELQKAVIRELFKEITTQQDTIDAYQMSENEANEIIAELKAELQTFKDMAKKGLDEFKDVGGCWGCGLQLQLNQDMEDIKQLKAKNERLKQQLAEIGKSLDEIQRLRDIIKSISKPVLLPDVPIEVTNKYKQTLQEIKAIVCGNYEIIDPQGRKDILKLITKAEEE